MRVTLGVLRQALLLSAAVGVAIGLAPVTGHAQVLSDAVRSRLAAWYRSAARSAPGGWGIAIANQTGEIIWSVKPDEPMIPASTVKVLTTGFARSVLGGDARLATRVAGTGHVDPVSGAWVGSWSLQLNGDPTLERANRGGPTLNELARQLASLGIRHLSGPLEVTSEGGATDVVYPAAWSPRHWGRIFAPLIGPITLNENVVWLIIRPGARVGAAAVLQSTAPQGLDALVNLRATTGNGRRSRLALTRKADGGLLVTGRIGLRSAPRRLISVASNPAAVLAETWASALRHAGIEWTRTAPDKPVDEGEGEGEQVLAEVNSPPLDSLATEINTRSLNIGAELLLQWAAGPDQGPELLTEHVQQVAGVAGGVRLVDGSGLSSDDRVTPATFVSYLARFPNTAAGKNFPMLLPANGTGTLRRLASGLPAPGVVHAKTGTLGNVSTLVGYLGRKDGELLISVMYNGGRPSVAKRAQWKLFRMLGADGMVIPTDSTGEELVEPEQLGGDQAK